MTFAKGAGITGLPALGVFRMDFSQITRCTPFQGRLNNLEWSVMPAQMPRLG